MNQYNIIVQQLLAYLTKRKQCSSSRLSHKQCYEEFGQYLEENNLYLSPLKTVVPDIQTDRLRLQKFTVQGSCIVFQSRE